MYESPIHVIEKDIQLQMEENICKAVKEVGISVDKEELINALKYDREQYSKGYEDGRADAIKKIIKLTDDYCDNCNGSCSDGCEMPALCLEIDELRLCKLVKKEQKND